jgi:CBS domain-containing protein
MNQSTAMEFLARHAPFDRLEPEAAHFVAAHLAELRFAAGQRIAGPETGAPKYLYVIVSGQVRAAESIGADGATWTLGEGECFPIGALSGSRPTTNAYDAVGETVCYALPAERFHRLVDSSKVFSRYCSNYLSNLLSESRRSQQARASQFAADQQSLAAELKQMIKRPPVTVTAATPLRRALELMNENRIGSIVVVDPNRVPLGILTQSDVLRRVVLAQWALTRPIAEVMSAPPLTQPENAHIYDAMFAMAARGVRHVLVVDDAGRLSGVVSERDLFALQRVGIGYIRRSIDAAQDVQTVAAAIRDTQQFAMNMLQQGVGADQITRFISALNDAATRRVIELNLPQHDLAGIEWVWLAFGSEGREEQTLSTDQDNGIIFVCHGVPAEAKARLVSFAQAVNADLDTCGYPLCEGKIMAGNPEWCMTLDDWKARFADWIEKPEPVALLNATIFFDFRTIYGKPAFAEELSRHLSGLARNSVVFQRMLAANALSATPPLGMFRDFVTESEDGGEPYIDLKKFGARLFVDAARVFALAHGIETANTVQRLRRAALATGGGPDANDALIDAFNFIQLLRLRHQYLEAGEGRRGNNRFPPSRLNPLDRRILKEAFRQAKRMQQGLSLSYQLSFF